MKNKSLHFLLLSFILSFMTVTSSNADTAHDFYFTSIEGDPLPLSTFKGKALLVVNTASQCGFTPQYENLQSLWTEYKDKGLVVLGVPSNDFLIQEKLIVGHNHY